MHLLDVLHQLIFIRNFDFFPQRSGPMHSCHNFIPNGPCRLLHNALEMLAPLLRFWRNWSLLGLKLLNFGTVVEDTLTLLVGRQKGHPTCQN